MAGQKVKTYLSTYTLTSPKFDGKIVVMYKSNKLVRMDLEISPQKPLNAGQQKGLMSFVPYQEEGLLNSAFIVKQETVLSTHAKIKMFCIQYRDHCNLVYQITDSEKRNIKSVKMDDDLLNMYFNCDEFWCKQKNVANYIHNINNILQLQANGGKAKSKYPSEWSEAYERRLPGAKEIEEYRRHLRSLGLKPVKHQASNKVIKWEK